MRTHKPWYKRLKPIPCLLLLCVLLSLGVGVGVWWYLPDNNMLATVPARIVQPAPPAAPPQTAPAPVLTEIPQPAPPPRTALPPAPPVPEKPFNPIPVVPAPPPPRAEIVPEPVPVIPEPEPELPPPPAEPPPPPPLPDTGVSQLPPVARPQNYGPPQRPFGEGGAVERCRESLRRLSLGAPISERDIYILEHDCQPNRR